MRAHQHHSSTARRALIAAIVGVVTFVVAVTITVGPASARDSSSEPSSPVSAFRSFAFELEVALTVGDGGEVTVSTRGSFVRPDAQDCEATAAFGPGVSVHRRAVVIGSSTWIDDGHGLEKSRPRDFDWEGECPSSREFWADFPFGDVPRGVHGTTQPRGGIEVEHIDLADTADAVTKLGFGSDLPPDTTFERASVWRSARHRVIVGLDFAVQGHSEAACREILEQEINDPAPSSCAMTIRLDLTRINDPDTKIKGGRGATVRRHPDVVGVSRT
jgi:hypothetical protein